MPGALFAAGWRWILRRSKSLGPIDLHQMLPEHILGDFHVLDLVQIFVLIAYLIRGSAAECP
jgi:hypothetical protein